MTKQYEIPRPKVMEKWWIKPYHFLWKDRKCVINVLLLCIGGGPLRMEQHRQLIRWAHDCAEHVLQFFRENIDERLHHALKVAKAWEIGEFSVGDARKASMGE